MEKLSPKERVEGSHTVLKGSVRAPEGFYKGKPKAENRGGAAPEVLHPRVCPRKIPREPSHCPAAQCSVGTQGTLLRKQFFSTLPQGFSIVAQTNKILRFIWGLHFPLVKCEGPHIPLVKCEGSHIPLVKCESFSSVVWTNCWLSPVVCGPLNLTQLPLDCDSLSTLECLDCAVRPPSV